jgi:hypothetical protein
LIYNDIPLACDIFDPWSRYKKVLNSMKKTHFHFVLHRLIKGRNRYTSICYKQNRKPLLPSAKIPKKDAS